MDIDGYLERFYQFSDSVIRSIDIRFRNREKLTCVSVEISTRDSEKSEAEQWCNVILTVEGVSEFSFQENSKASYQVISNGINMLKSNGWIYVDFGHLDSLVDSNEIRKSPAYVVGKDIFWKTMPYRESN